MAKYDLKTLRKDLGINQEVMAAKLDVTQGFISRLEQGHKPMPHSLEDKFRMVFPEIDLAKYEIDENSLHINANGSKGSANYNSKVSTDGPIKDVVACFKEQDKIINETLRILRADLESERKRSAELDERLTKLSDENRELLIEKMQKENTILKLQMRLMQAGLPHEL